MFSSAIIALDIEERRLRKIAEKLSMKSKKTEDDIHELVSCKYKISEICFAMNVLRKFEN